MITEKFIPTEEFIEILETFIYLKERKMFKVCPNLSVKQTEFGPTIDMTIYLESYISGEKISIPLTEEDIKPALLNFAHTNGFELQSYLYVGGIRKVGLYVDENTPFFNGIILYLKELKKEKEWYVQKR